jgi:hypothetical protein
MISDIIETIQTFVDYISGIVDAWNTFSRTELALFTTYARDKVTWPNQIININRSIMELDQLQKLLLTKRERFKFKLDSVKPTN